MLIIAHKMISLVWYWNPFLFRKVFFFKKDLFKNSLCASMCPCGYTHNQQHVGAWWDQKMALDLLELDRQWLWAAWCWYWELKSDPLEEYQGLFTIEPSHQHQEDVLCKNLILNSWFYCLAACSELSYLTFLNSIKPLKSEGKGIHLKRMFWKTKHKELWPHNLVWQKRSLEEKMCLFKAKVQKKTK